MRSRFLPVYAVEDTRCLRKYQEDPWMFSMYSAGGQCVEADVDFYYCGSSCNFCCS